MSTAVTGTGWVRWLYFQAFLLCPWVRFDRVEAGSSRLSRGEEGDEVVGGADAAFEMRARSRSLVLTLWAGPLDKPWVPAAMIPAAGVG